jgi:hypothetical protein
VVAETSQDFKFTGNERELKLELRKGSLEMKVVISAKQNKGRQDFVSEVNFSKNGKEIRDLQELDDDLEFKGLMEEYAKQAKSFDREDYDRMIRESESKGRFSEQVKNVILVLETVWRGLTVLTVDSNKRPVARTTIEPDADVLTVLRPDLRSQKQMKALLDIQATNVSLVNRFFKYRLLGFVRTFRKVVLRGRIITVPAGGVLTLTDLNFLTLPHLSDIQETLTRLDFSKLLADTAAMQSVGIIILQVLLPVATFFLQRYYGRVLIQIFKLFM